MKKIKKKTWPENFEKVLSGEKTYELRLADFKVEPGDVLLLEEWDPETKKYTGRKLEKKVSFVLKTKDVKFWNKEDIKKHGLQIISLKG